ncbi:MAG: homoserine dehydrogenase [Methanobacteriaceae archaeon]|jgi:homoserine dehydrogenase|uniref:homoserine dehydrogenase n=1 Tax=Methanobrevibacter TaxID=2172 RepID=UPI002A12F4CB|nr:homoserine dehydrogenase [Methanobacteriaceae archaeon]MDD3408934.1 homoserine dehydrogenase [Methanobacteriaceae archaeon]MDD4595010.1 homoserine dehydrogenase [Methanobacteriaceae archaeon]
MDECKIIVMGFGSVGQGIVKAIKMEKDKILETLGINLKIVAVADSCSSAINPDGLNVEELLKTKSEKGKLGQCPNCGTTNTDTDVLDNVDYDVLMECTPTNIDDGEPARTLTLKAFSQGKDVVTSNKGHLALNYKELDDAAKANNVMFKFEASVGGAMPIINYAKDALSGNQIISIIGILNGTTNYILSRMTSEGSSYPDTLKESQMLGIAETNPTQDVEGIDAACKAVILSNSVLGQPATYSDVEVEGISNITSEAVSLAKENGYLIKLITEVSPKTLKVSPRLVKQGSSYDLNGTLNMATLKTDLADEVTTVGKGAGSLETASAMMTDLITILRTKN